MIANELNLNVHVSDFSRNFHLLTLQFDLLIG